MVTNKVTLTKKWTGILASLLLFALSISTAIAQEQINSKPVNNFIRIQTGIVKLSGLQTKPIYGNATDYFSLKAEISLNNEFGLDFYIKNNLSISTGICWSRNYYTHIHDFPKGNPFTYDSTKRIFSWIDHYNLFYIPIEISKTAHICPFVDISIKGGLCINYLEREFTSYRLYKYNYDTIFKENLILNKTDKLFISLRATTDINFRITKHFGVFLNAAYVYSDKTLLEGKTAYYLNNQNISELKFFQKLRQFQVGFGLRLSIISVSKLFY